MDYSLEETAARLGITPTTLHQWNTQFATLLSDFAYKELALKGLAVQRRFTAADIAMLQHAQILLQRGHTYDQVRRALTKQQSNQPIDTDSPLVALEHHQDMVSVSAGLPTRGAHAGAERDAPIVTPPVVDPFPQGLIAQLADSVRRRWRQRLPRRLPSSLSASLALCCIAILAGLSVVVLFEEPSVGNNTQRTATMPAASATPTLNSALLPGVQSTVVPLSLTPSALRTATPHATVTLPATSPPTRIAPPSMTATVPVATSVALPLPRAMTIGDQGGKTVRVRKAASLKAAPLNVALAEGMSVIIIGGPVEADGYTWWNVEVDGRQGWCVCTFVPPR
jgi:DNA-binding transcriptional MerR regulator